MFENLPRIDYFCAACSASLPDARSLTRRFAAEYEQDDFCDFRWSVRENDGEFRNEVCSVRYENKEELSKPPLFGAKFHFTLDSQVNCPEFLAYFPLLKQ
ncbi:unnamed protein product [Nippostrongylus brasiliensis]|uniref:mRNA cap 0 methyltransferase domain-containing protein n=1 Tax=Nippostrongylus brasiliensis TaxID=27835 RepID=A0A0N4XJ02_NIPBR|nr:unnamed protein product [Nippostrongylus brasiliensis]